MYIEVRSHVFDNGHRIRHPKAAACVAVHHCYRLICRDNERARPDNGLGKNYRVYNKYD